MINVDKTTKVILIWIAMMLTFIALKELLPVPMLVAQDANSQASIVKPNGPIEVIIGEPVSVKIVDWNAYPSQPFKVKIDDPWPARVEIQNDVNVKGELRLQN